MVNTPCFKISVCPLTRSASLLDQVIYTCRELNKESKIVIFVDIGLDSKCFDSIDSISQWHGSRTSLWCTWLRTITIFPKISDAMLVVSSSSKASTRGISEKRLTVQMKSPRSNSGAYREAVAEKYDFLIIDCMAEHMRLCYRQTFNRLLIA